MNEEMLINVTPMEIRVALIENCLLQEVYVERAHSRGIVGNIFRGKVVRVLPGMQAAFVDIGLERASFLHVSDIIELDSDGLEIRDGSKDDIRAHVVEGKAVTVQVVKDPIGTKGARLTTRLSISSRYLVYTPYSNHIGISQRIEDEDERARLRAIVEDIRSQEVYREMSGGFIVRTAADGLGEAEIRADIEYLRRQWRSIARKARDAKVTERIYRDLPLYLRVIRDSVRPGLEKIRVDDTRVLENIREFAREFVPQVESILELYEGDRLLFDLNGVEDEIQKALEKRVDLKSGGYLIIEQTEAMNTVDVNTGAFVGHRNLEETIFKTNLEAATALARQIRVRNLGGIIIIDFIDMRDPEHQRQVLRTLEKALEKDRAKTALTGVSELGLVEMTRKRTRESLERTLSEDCATCEGRGRVKTAATICYEIFRDIIRDAHLYEGEHYLVLASQSVVDCLLDEESANLADLETRIGKTIKFQVEVSYTQEQFDIILM